MTKAKAVPNDLSAWESDIDLPATQELIDKLQTEGKPWDKIKAGSGKYIVNYRRICPKRPEWPNPYQITPVHYLGPHKRLVLCLKESGRGECPACQLRWELHEAGAEAEERMLRVSIRTFLNVVHIDKNGELEDDKVYLLGLNQLQFIGKRGVQYDPDEESELPLYDFFKKYGDLSHAAHGRDLLIKAKEDKSGDFDTTSFKFSVAEPSPFPGTSELLSEGLGDIHDVAALVSAEEMMETIEGRSTGSVPVVIPAGEAVPQIAAPTPEPAKEASRFGGGAEDTEEPAPESTIEEEATDARASSSPPKADPTAALKRLRANQAKE